MPQTYTMSWRLLMLDVAHCPHRSAGRSMYPRPAAFYQMPRLLTRPAGFDLRACCMRLRLCPDGFDLPAFCVTRLRLCPAGFDLRAYCMRLSLWPAGFDLPAFCVTRLRLCPAGFDLRAYCKRLRLCPAGLDLRTSPGTPRCYHYRHTAVATRPRLPTSIFLSWQDKRQTSLHND